MSKYTADVWESVAKEYGWNGQDSPAIFLHKVFATRRALAIENSELRERILSRNWFQRKFDEWSREL